MKKLIALLLSLLFIATAFAGCSPAETPAESTTEVTEGTTEEEVVEEESSEPLKVGFAFYNLANPVWADVVQTAVEYGEENNMEVTFVDAGQDSQLQISQMETFIQGGMDAICILAVDGEAVENVCKQALDAGIYVIDYSRSLENAHSSLTLDPEVSGPALVKMAEPWIREKYGDEEFEWAHLDIPTVEIGVQQGEAIERTMLELFPNSKLVFNGATLSVDEGQSNTENLIQANPNVRVILSQSAGGGVGGNEAIKTVASADEYDDWGLFSIDATEQEVLNIINGDPQKASISLGGGAEHGRMIIDMIAELASGGELDKITALPASEITAENAQEFYDATYAE